MKFKKGDWVVAVRSNFSGLVESVSKNGTVKVLGYREKTPRTFKASQLRHFGEETGIAGLYIGQVKTDGKIKKTLLFYKGMQDKRERPLKKGEPTALSPRGKIRRLKTSHSAVSTTPNRRGRRGARP